MDVTPEPEVWRNERLARPVSAVWGFAEATLFFVVPDVALGFIALRSRKVALAACLWAFAGALLGGVVMYTWGRVSVATAEATLQRVPAINEVMIARVRGELEEGGAAALATGPLRTTPYKIYAVEAGSMRLSPLSVLAASVPSRLGRFVATVLVVSAFARYPLRRLSMDQKRLVLGLVLAVIYVILMTRPPS